MLAQRRGDEDVPRVLFSRKLSAEGGKMFLEAKRQYDATMGQIAQLKALAGERAGPLVLGTRPGVFLSVWEHVELSIRLAKTETWGNKWHHTQAIGDSYMLSVGLFGRQYGDVNEAMTFVWRVMAFLSSWGETSPPQERFFEDEKGKMSVNLLACVADPGVVTPLVAYMGAWIWVWDVLGAEAQRLVLRLALSWFDHYWGFVKPRSSAARGLLYGGMYAVLADMRKLTDLLLPLKGKARFSDRRLLAAFHETSMMQVQQVDP